LGDNPADQDADVVEPLGPQPLHDLRHQRHVSAAEDAHAEPVRIFIRDRSGDGVDRLPKPGVNDVHAGVAQGPGHDLDTAVMPVQADFRQHNTNGVAHALRLRQTCLNSDASKMRSSLTHLRCVAYQKMRRSLLTLSLNNTRIQYQTSTSLPTMTET